MKTIFQSLKKVSFVLAASVLGVVSLGANVWANECSVEKNLIEPESVHTKHSEKKCEKKKESSNLSKRNRNISCTFEVGSDYEFIQAIKKSEDGDKIVVTRDIYLPFGLEISKSVQINLGGHRIVLNDPEAQIVIGKKVVSDVRPYEVTVREGYYSNEIKKKVTKHPDQLVYDVDGSVKRVEVKPTVEEETYKLWHPPVTEVRQKNIYSYLDDVDVLFQNGLITRADAKKGNDGKKDSPYYYNGADGKDAVSIFRGESGVIRFYDVRVIGGNGGNGGDGGYQSLVHLPFGGGDAGNGGNGGSAGAVIDIYRKSFKVVTNDNSVLETGRPGIGGRRGEINPNYWVLPGSKGKEGRTGRARDNAVVYLDFD